MKTDILVVMDRSGSMSSTWDDAVGGLNAFIKDQKELPDEATLTLAWFDDRHGVHWDRIALPDVPALIGNEFSPRGGTALLDAIGKAVVSHKERTVKSDKTILVVITDGHENASKEFTQSTIKTLLDSCEKEGWTVMYLGADQDAFSIGTSMGFAGASAAAYSNTPMGNASMYRGLSASVSSLRSTGKTESLQSLVDSAEKELKVS